MKQTDLMEQTGGEPRHPRLCTATSKRSHEPCRKWAMKGGLVCSTHGGKAPQAMAKAAAALELAEARLRGLAGPAVATLEELVTAPPAKRYAWLPRGTRWTGAAEKPANASKWPLRSWCEVAMVWTEFNLLTREEYTKLHCAAHPMHCTLSKMRDHGEGGPFGRESHRTDSGRCVHRGQKAVVTGAAIFSYVTRPNESSGILCGQPMQNV